MFTLPGTPVIRYGDELGMGDDYLRRSEIARARRCNGPTNLTAASPSMTSRFVRSSAKAVRLQHINAAMQRRHPESLLNWTERIIRMRKEVPEIGWGDFSVDPHAQPRGPGDALRLAKQFRPLCSQFRCRTARNCFLRRERKANMANLLVNLLGTEHSKAATMESITWSSRAMGTDGTASAGSIIC